MTVEATCAVCGETYDAPDTQRYPMCRDCWSDWDMAKCPDGQEHDLKFDGHASFRNDPDKQLYKVGECRRCGTGYLSEL